MAKNGIKWEVINSCSWVHVTPTGGTGDTIIKVSADPIGKDDTNIETSCKVTIKGTYKLGDEDKEKNTEFTVYRCPYECTCDDFEIKYPEELNLNIEGIADFCEITSLNTNCKVNKDDFKCVVNGDYDVLDNGVEMNEDGDKLIVQGYVLQNTANRDRNINIKIYRGNELCTKEGDGDFNQSGQECNCGNLTLKQNWYSFEYDQEKVVLTDVIDISCDNGSDSNDFEISTVINEGFIKNIDVSVNNNKANINLILEKNDTGVSRHDYLVFKYKGEKCEGQEISIVQDAEPTLAFNCTEYEWSSQITENINETDYVKIATLSQSYPNTANVTIKKSDNWIETNFDDGITLKAKASSSCEGSGRKGTITVEYTHDDGTTCPTETFNVEQTCASTPCNIEISGDTTTLDCTGGTVTYKIIPKGS